MGHEAAASVERNRPSDRLAGFRSAAVSFGPSILVDGLAAAATLATVRRIFAPHRARRRPPLPWLLAAGAPWLYLAAVRPWVLQWGARPGEVGAALPGDEIVPQPAWSSTRAI